MMKEDEELAEIRQLIREANADLRKARSDGDQEMFRAIRITLACLMEKEMRLTKGMTS